MFSVRGEGGVDEPDGDASPVRAGGAGSTFGLRVRLKADRGESDEEFRRCGRAIGARQRSL